MCGAIVHATRWASAMTLAGCRLVACLQPAKDGVLHLPISTWYVVFEADPRRGRCPLDAGRQASALHPWCAGAQACFQAACHAAWVSAAMRVGMQRI
jgi:hypothetical protein